MSTLQDSTLIMYSTLFSFWLPDTHAQPIWDESPMQLQEILYKLTIVLECYPKLLNGDKYSSTEPFWKSYTQFYQHLVQTRYVNTNVVLYLIPVNTWIKTTQQPKDKIIDID